MDTLNIYEDKHIAIKIFLTVYLISSFFFKPYLAFARFELLTKAIAHYGTTSIDKIQQITGIQCIDSLTLNGHTYIEPTPGLSFIALASYLPYAIFLQSSLIRIFSLDPLLELKVSQFVMALSTVILFTALLIAVFFLSLRQIGCSQKKAIIFSFLLYFGTPVIFYSLHLSNGQDILQMALLFIAFFIMRISKIQNIRLIFLSGLLFGLSVFVNIVSLFFLPLFLSIIILVRQRRTFFTWIIGTAFGVMPLLIYNQISFGNLLRTSYNARYGAALSLHLAGFLNIIGILLASPTIGLIFFFPFVIMLLPMARKLCTSLMNKLILFAVLFYIVCLSIGQRSLLIAVDSGKSIWFYLDHVQGGGGPRYLLPIIPFLLYVMAGVDLDLKWKKILASALMFISIIINAPGLFWTGGSFLFLTNLLFLCKNGFHSYMVELIRDILIRRGFNTGGLSLFPLLTILGIFLWWIWIGERWVRDSL